MVFCQIAETVRMDHSDLVDHQTFPYKNIPEKHFTVLKVTIITQQANVAIKSRFFNLNPYSLHPRHHKLGSASMKHSQLENNRII